MHVDVITPFPGMIESFFNESMLKRACDKGVVTISTVNLRDFTFDKHRTVDDAPYGGGPGMILKPEPIFLAVDSLKKKNPEIGSRVIFMSPQGETYTQEKAFELAKESHLIFICGHYRGVDQRVVDALVTDEISIGDYILTGGELAAAVVIDSVVRLLPGVLGDFDSAEKDTFTCGILDHPHYTRPEVFNGMKVPEVLLSGHHAKIEEWRKQKALEKTKEKRPDLLKKESSDKTSK